MKLKGKIVAGKFGGGSKSEHEAIYIHTEKGEYVLRLVGDNPFENSELRSLIGKDVVATGTLKSYLFLAKEIKEVK
jgi:hypothetical protein